MSQPKRRLSIQIDTGGKTLKSSHVKLFTPALKEIAEKLKVSLAKNFENVEVSVVDCPDLTKWGVAEKGLSGNTRIADVGGMPYVLDPNYQKVAFQLPDIISTCKMSGPSLVLGSGTASPTVIGTYGAVILNTLIPGARHNRCAKIDTKRTKDPKDEKEAKEEIVQLVEHYPSEEIGCSANLFISDGKAGPVIYIKVSKRSGKTNFTNSIREGLQTVDDVGQKKQIGMGGVFKLNKGKVKSFIFREFPDKKVEPGNLDEIKDWLHYENCGPDLLMFTVLLSGDPTADDSLHLRMEHTNFYATGHKSHEAGHYVFDTSPDEVEYEGYFQLAQYVYRIEDAYFNIAQANKQ